MLNIKNLKVFMNVALLIDFKNCFSESLIYFFTVYWVESQCQVGLFFVNFVVTFKPAEQYQKGLKKVFAAAQRCCGLTYIIAFYFVRFL